MEKKRKSMYDLLMAYNDIMTEIESSDGELTDDNTILLNINKDEVETKLSGYKNFIKFLKTTTDNNKAEKKRYDAKNKSIKRRIETLNNVVLAALTEFGVKTKTGTLTIKNELFTLYAKQTKTLIVDDKFSNYNYTVINYNVNVPNGTLIGVNTSSSVDITDVSFADVINTIGVTCEITTVINERLIKSDIIAGIYKCDNAECKGHETSKYDDCDCLDRPYLATKQTPIFR